MFPDWLDKGIIILQYGKHKSIVWAQTGMGKLALLFSFPPPFSNYPSSPAIPPPPPSLFIPHKTYVLALSRVQTGEGVSPLLHSSAPSCDIFSSLE